jgi:hypothetical protein
MLITREINQGIEFVLFDLEGMACRAKVVNYYAECEVGDEFITEIIQYTRILDQLSEVRAG